MTRQGSPGKTRKKNPSKKNKGSAPKKKSPQAGGNEILFGFHSVFEALQAKKRNIHTVYLSEKRNDQRLDEIASLAQKNHIPTKECTPEQLTIMADSKMHQGVGALTDRFPVRPGMEILDMLEKNPMPCFFLVLESIEDPHNLGALIRSGVCAGADGILIPKNRSALPTPTVSRTSAGAMEHADIFLMTNTAAVLRKLREKGVWIMGLDADSTNTVYNADMTMPLALVVGGEHKGLRPVVRKLCHEILSIPMEGRVNSLNASVAGAVGLFEVVRQRKFSW